ncbi:MAG: type II toxin-antitoxin system PemK/MazF family toxin [Acetobacteraceae bacterium]
MPVFETWDVVKVPFPYTNRPVRQRRPGLVLRSGEHEGIIPHLLWVLMITSSENRGPGDVEISDLVISGLPASSIVRTAKVATIEASDADRIGRLPAPDRLQVARCIRSALRRAWEG